VGKVIELSSVRVTPLLPCPFCGGAEVELDSDDACVWAHCDGCQAQGPTSFVGCREFDGFTDQEVMAFLEKEATEMWNARKNPTNKQENEGDSA
jgi:Lar family restriction alleviation protein